jgi:hypothetical protein
MAWPGQIPYRDTAEAFVLVPRPEAMIQDLGAFRTGRYFETDILPRSALVAVAEGDGPAVTEDGEVLFAFEGNAIDAANLHRFYEKARSAAGRLAQGYPSISYGRALPEQLLPVARYDLERYVFTEILDQKALEEWCGEELASWMPPKIETPCEDMDVLKPIFSLPMEPALSRGRDMLMWKFTDGNILVKHGEAPFRLLSPDSDEVKSYLERYEADERETVLIIGTQPPDITTPEP